MRPARFRCASVSAWIEIFCWLEAVGGLRKTRLIGHLKLIGQMLLGCAADNAVRMGNLIGDSGIRK